jgi:hypothetical protein
MSFTLFLNSANSSSTGGNANYKLFYNFDFSTVPPHPQGTGGKYRLTMNLLTSALASAATPADVGYITVDFSCTKYIYGLSSSNGAIASNFIGYIAPLAYSSANLISHYLEIPIIMTKPINNYFAVEMKNFNGTAMTRIASTVSYILTISFTAIIENDGFTFQTDHLLDYKK